LTSEPLHLVRNSQIVGSLVFFYCPFALWTQPEAGAFRLIDHLFM